MTEIARVRFFEGCGEAETIDEPIPQPIHTQPYLLAVTADTYGTALSDGAVKNIARKLGRTVEWVREMEAAGRLGEVIKMLDVLPKNGGGCNGGGSTKVNAPSTGSGPSGSGGRIGGNTRTSIDIGLFGIFILIVGRIALATLSAPTAAASLLFGVSLSPPPEA